MKLIFPLFFWILFSNDVYGQDTIEQPQSSASKIEFNYTNPSFVPHRNLMNTDLWKRVGNNRFECEYLRLAVEFRDHTYVLIEMDGEERIMARSINYNRISSKIIELTLNSRPSF